MTRRALIDENVTPVDLEKLLCDSYTICVTQTTMDYAITEVAAYLINNIRPTVRPMPRGEEQYFL